MDLKISGLDHLVLTVASMNESCDFYQRVLGLRMASQDETRAALLFGGQKINLHQAGKGISPVARNPAPGSADFCLVTRAPLLEVAAHLQAQGVEIELGPVQRQGALGEMNSIYFRDPDLNLVEICSYEN